MYAVTSTPLDRRTRATFRRAELGFFGVMILTCKHTPLRCGQPCKAGCLGRRYCWTRGLRTSWLIVGMFRRSTQCRSTPATEAKETGGRRNSVRARLAAARLRLARGGNAGHAAGNHYRSGTSQAGQEGTAEQLPRGGEPDGPGGPLFAYSSPPFIHELTGGPQGI